MALTASALLVCTLAVTFSPTSAGAKSASVQVSGTPGGTAPASLTGTAVAPLPPPYAPQLTRYPYLTDVAGGGATINWATDQSSASAYVTWGVAGVESCTAHSSSATRTQITVGSTPEYQWKARLKLAPDTTYCYRVYLGKKKRHHRSAAAAKQKKCKKKKCKKKSTRLDLLGSNPAPRFVTALPAGSTTRFKFAVLGDWGAVSASGNPDQANLLGRLASSGARFALSTGDIAYPGGARRTTAISTRPEPMSARCSVQRSGLRQAPRCRSSRCLETTA